MMCRAIGLQAERMEIVFLFRLLRMIMAHQLMQ